MKKRSSAVGYLLILLAFLFVAVFILLPVATVVKESLADGFGNYLSYLKAPGAKSALILTVITAVIAVPLNTIFGIMLAWAIAKYRFRGRRLLSMAIEIPYAVSPVVAGLMIVMVFGSTGLLRPLLDALGLKVLFAAPGIIFASAFVTFPYVAKELIPLMAEIGNSEEEAAVSLGAGFFRTFFSVTLPNIKWGLFYGIILTNARVIGEFGAVSIVSGKMLGKTATLPVYIELLYSNYEYVAAFTIASVLMLLALVTLVLKFYIELKERKHPKSIGAS
ncbi:MAG: sulfate ABC transporter permease subunit CysW [Succinivibrionaceae bacterium]|nr:sulfate ABC transporter permease subunit CysW [Succinivibrionaceae bacterium]MDY6337669.1 sulfate ABC transporter permease subunit CysW [Succinivibrionaceae bacterium]